MNASVIAKAAVMADGRAGIPWISSRLEVRPTALSPRSPIGVQPLPRIAMRPAGLSVSAGAQSALWSRPSSAGTTRRALSKTHAP